MHGLIELDVTEARRLIAQHQAQTGEQLSFTAFIIHCLGRSLNDFPEVHAMRDWRGRLVIYDDVDVTIMIEIALDGEKFPLAHVLRAVNHRSHRDLHDEIRRVQGQGAGEISPGQRRGLRVFLMLPRFIRDIFYWAILKNPHWFKRVAGTVIVTAIGMFGEGGGWGITLPIFTLSLTLGGIARKPGIIGQDEMAIREYLSVTISVDHDVVDGAPGARFARRFKELVEAAHGLDDMAADNIDDLGEN